MHQLRSMSNFILISVLIFSTSVSCEILLYKISTSGGNIKEKIPDSLDHFIFNNQFHGVLCEADEPLEWSYAGEGSPSKVIERSKRVNETHISSTLSFSVKVPAKRAGEDEVYDYVQHTGFYICKGLNSSKNATVFVYFPDSRSPILSNEYSATPVIQVPIVTGTAKSELPVANYLIPCVPSNPSTELSLHFGDNVTLSSKNLPDNVTYDPKFGFRFKIPLTQYPGLFKTGGSDDYTCTARKSKRRIESKLFTVKREEAPKVKAFPPERVIYVATALNLTCEADQPVRITELWSEAQDVDSGSASRENATLDEDLEETTEITPSDKHIANFYDPHPLLGTSGEFHCVTDSNHSEILHSWHSFVVGEEKIRKSGIRYSKKKKEFRCRTQLDESGFLSYVNCINPNECNINKRCFEKSFRCRGYGDLLLNWCSEEPKCKKLVHLQEKGRGFLRCLSLESDGIDEVQEFDETGLPSQSRSTGGHAPQLIIDHSEVGEGGAGSILNVTLVRSSYHFIGGHQWYITYKEDGAMKRQELEPVSESDFNDSVTASFILPTSLSLSAPLELISKVPRRGSMEWVTVTVNGIEEIVIGTSSIETEATTSLNTDA